jgi:hypothetical protein
MQRSSRARLLLDSDWATWHIGKWASVFQSCIPLLATVFMMLATQLHVGPIYLARRYKFVSDSVPRYVPCILKSHLRTPNCSLLLLALSSISHPSKGTCKYPLFLTKGLTHLQFRKKKVLRHCSTTLC